jgi:anti-sigma factor ChrR (cupin superfamily)
MVMQSHSTDAVQERAALYAAGALPDDEQREFEAHLQAGCSQCQAEVDAFQVVGARLGAAAPARRPRPELRRLVQETVDRSAGDSATTEQDGVLFVRSQLLPWMTHPKAGVQIKRLHHDPQRGYRTSLVRMQPGDKYPRHRHSDVEEVYLIEGDLRVNGVVMSPGDYCRAEPGSSHNEVVTERGCTFMVVACEHDEFL